MNETLTRNPPAAEEPRTAAGERAGQTGSIELEPEHLQGPHDGGHLPPPPSPPNGRPGGAGGGRGDRPVPRWKLLVLWGFMIVLSFFCGGAIAMLGRTLERGLKASNA